MRKLLCFIGIHKWEASLEDYINEFGSVPLNGKVVSTSICSCCGKAYK